MLKKLVRKIRRQADSSGSKKVKQMHFVDGSFPPAKKGALMWIKPRKGTKVMAIVDEKSKPLSILIAAASVHEVRLVEALLNEKFSAQKPRRLTAGRAYDSDRLDEKLQGKGIELNAPHRKGRRKAATQDGRKLRAYKRRWKIERFFAWLFNFRRCVVRYEQRAENFKTFLLLAAATLLIR